ncbi:MAG TPA: YdeI/OmpD-associated family protein [Bryobacteraceae bacterium]|nr:YdeI/OmpD-associated family protein [Bryobacteraceae bacterium]
MTSPAAFQTFRSPADFRKWLSANHHRSDGIWLRIFKKNSGRPTITYAEALDEALCFGWIDGQKQSHDGLSWLQRFTRRRARSGWSKINTQHAERLIRDARMKPPGKAEVDAAKKDGRWKAAYDSPGNATIPKDFLTALSKDAKAKAFFDLLNKANTYAIAYRLQTAKKPETRQRRIANILAMLANGEKFHGD